MSNPLIADLAPRIFAAESLEAAFAAIAQAALGVGRTRHALIAVVNDERGDLEIGFGAGDDWEAIAKNRRLPMEVKEHEGFVAWAAATGRSIESGRVLDEPYYRTLFDTTVSELALPIKDAHERVRAVLNLESDQENAYAPEDRANADGLVALTRFAIDRDDRNQREQALIRIGKAMDDALDETSLFQRVLEVTKQTLRPHSCSIFLTDELGNAVLRSTIGALRDQVGTLRYRPGEGLTGRVCQTGQPLNLVNPQSHPDWRGKYIEIPNDQVASFIAVPIAAKGRVYGVIRLLRRVPDNPNIDNRFTDSDQQLLQAIAEQVAMGLANIRHIERMIRDERMVAWGELSAKSSHMIGNRVFALRGDVNELGHLVTEGDLEPEDIAGLQRSLQTNVVRIEEILQDFRDFVTAIQVERIPTDIAAMVAETAREMFPRRSEYRLELEMDPRTPLVAADPKRLRRAVSELIENSLSHMARGALRVSVTQSPFHDALEIVIADEGPGVPVEQKELIFQPFFSGRVRGMGLGLSIVRGIIDAHGGTVTEEGEIGQGARFVIRLPIPVPAELGAT